MASPDAQVNSTLKIGTNVNSRPLNDPLPDVQLNPTTGALQTTPSVNGTPSLLDTSTITKPDLSSLMTVELSTPDSARKGDTLNYRVSIANNSTNNLNGVQVVVTLPPGVDYNGSLVNATLVGHNQVVLTIGRLGAGETHTRVVRTLASTSLGSEAMLTATATVRSATGQPLTTNNASTSIR